MQKKTTTLIYGTGNAGKLDLMRHYLSTLQEIRLLGLKDLHFAGERLKNVGRTRWRMRGRKPSHITESAGSRFFHRIAVFI